MNRSVKSLSGNRNLVTAVLVAATLLSIQLVQEILQSILYFPVVIRQVTETGTGSAVEFLPGLLTGILTTLLPFALGVVLCLWLLAPIIADQRAISVIWRLLLASVMGAVALLLVTFFVALIGNVNDSDGLVYGWAFAGLTSVLGNAGWATSRALFSAGNALIYVTPLIVLAGILVWLPSRTRLVEASAGREASEV